MKFHRSIIGALALLCSSLAHGAGTLPIVLTQQFAFTNCVTNTNACGTPLSGGLLYFYQAGTTNVVQNSFQDTALTILNSWPLPLDANGRIPPFYLADGSIHVVLRDAGGVTQFDYQNMLVIGPSGGGGGGAGVDPTTIAATGDIKFRATSEFVTGWVKLNGQTIGNAISGASQRANADTQALYLYLWANCPNAHCPVVTGRGATAIADFNANKQLTVIDMRGRGLAGLDDMGNAAAGRILAGNITSGGGDGVTTPNATGGEANHFLSFAELPAHNHAATSVSNSNSTSVVTDPGHAHFEQGAPTGGGNTSLFSINTGAAPLTTTNVTQSSGVNGTGISVATSTTTTTTTTTNNSGGGGAHNTMAPFLLGSWYVKL